MRISPRTLLSHCESGACLLLRVLNGWPGSLERLLATFVKACWRMKSSARHLLCCSSAREKSPQNRRFPKTLSECLHPAAAETDTTPGLLAICACKSSLLPFIFTSLPLSFCHLQTEGSHLIQVAPQSPADWLEVLCWPNKVPLPLRLLSLGRKLAGFFPGHV